MKSSVINRLLFILAFGVMLARGFLFTGALPMVHLALLAGKIALIPVALVLTLRTPGKPTPVDLALLVYGVVMAVCCLLNHTQILTITLLALDVFIFWALCRWFFVRKSLFPFKAVTLILFVFIAVNFLLMLWRPDGLWRYQASGKMYFLLGGNYNNMGKALFIALIGNILLLRLLPEDAGRDRRLYWVVLILLALLSGITVWFVGSKTSLIGLLLVMGFSVLLLPTALRPSAEMADRLGVLSVLRAVAMVALVVVYFALQSWAVFSEQETAAPKAEYFVENVLKKDLTFSLRTHIWRDAKQLIERKPVIGYGEHDDKWYQEEFGGLTTHNLVLHVLLKGGWVALSALIVLLLFTHARLLLPDKRTEITPFQRVSSYDVRFILLFGLWIYLFMMIFEVYPFFSLSMLFVYASYIPFRDSKMLR